MMAPEGTEVRAGTPVLGFDTTGLQQRLDAAIAEVDSARKRVEKKRIDLTLQQENNALRLAEAEATLRRTTLMAARPPELTASIEHRKAELDLELAERELGSLRIEHDATHSAGVAELDGLIADLRTAEIRVSELQDGINRATVEAPCDGIVVHSSGRYNAKMKVGDTAWYRNEIIEIPDLHTHGLDRCRRAQPGRCGGARRTR
jgi:multidrug resistance efflux pump